MRTVMYGIENAAARFHLPVGPPQKQCSACTSLSFKSKKRIFRVRVHSKFGHVEPNPFTFLCHSDRLELVHDCEDDISGAKSPHCAERCAHKLHPELSGVTVQQAGYPLSGDSEIACSAHSVPTGAIRPIGKNAD